MSLDVSVVIPTRDRCELLAQSLRSALDQTGVDVEVVVVDDGSQDGTSAMLASVTDARIRVLSLPYSRGVAHARNRGVECAKGSWIAFLDDDDVWTPSKLAKQLAVAGDAVLVFCASRDIDLRGEVVGTRRIAFDEKLLRSQIETNVIGSPSSVVVRADVLRCLGGFDERLTVLADWDLWVRLLARGDAVFCDEVLVAYRVHPDNMHVRGLSLVHAELTYLRQKHLELARAHGTEFGALPFRQWIAERYRAQDRRLDAAREYLQIGVRYRRPRDLARGLVMPLGERAMAIGGRARGETPIPGRR